MASVSVSEETFAALASAARIAWDAGNRPLAMKLDKLARMTNAALSAAGAPRIPGAPQTKSITWRDVPSTFEPLHKKAGP